MADRELDVLLYGATGFTGRLAARQLEARGLRYAIAGRDKAKLDTLRGQLASKPETLVLSVDDAAGLARAAARASVVLTCAGPFAKFGRQVQDAALASQAHFIDVTGEHSYMLETYQRDEEAKRAGVVLLNAAGFDVVPTDLCVWLACKGIDEPELVELAFAAAGKRLSHGTMKSALGALEAGCPCWENGRWVKESIGHHSRHVAFPDPVGPRFVVSVPWGDVITAPRTSGARNVRVYTVTGAVGGRMLPLLGPLLPLAAKPPFAQLVSWMIESSPEGPSDEERAASRFTIWAEATDKAGSKQFALVEGRDPYGLTAVTSVYFAETMAAGGYGKSGSLTPCQAADPTALAEFLRGYGVSTMSPA